MENSSTQSPNPNILSELTSLTAEFSNLDQRWLHESVKNPVLFTESIAKMKNHLNILAMLLKGE